MARDQWSSGDITLKASTPTVGGVKTMATFFGDADTASLTEFYRGGGLVPDNNFNSAIPTGGAISMTQFRNATNETYALSVTAAPINETTDKNVIITLTTTNVPNNTVINSRTTGVQTQDVVGATSLDFPFTVNNNTATSSFTIVEDFVSDGGFDSNGIPLAGNENATTTLYQGAAGGDEIGGDDGSVSWQIVDTSLSWYAVVTQPTISGGIYVTSNSYQEIRAEGYNSVVTVPVSMPAFIMNASYNNPTLRDPSVSFSVSVSLDSSYGTSGRLCSGHQYSLNQESNRTLYNGNTYTPSPPSWSSNTTNPSIQVHRDAYFPTGLTYGTYQMVIQERGRFIFTELSSPNRVLGATGGGMNFQTPQCIFKSTHTLEVTESGGG